MKNILLVINPVSGKQKIQGKLSEIENIFKSSGFSISTKVTEYRGHAEELAKSAKNNGFDTIICCGGDGTLNETISGLMKSETNRDVTLGYIPCGSTNDFAETLGLCTNPLTQAERICHLEKHALDIGLFNSERYFSYIASFGALTDASYSAPQKLKNKVGHFAYILEGLKDFWHIKPITAKISANGQSYEGRFAFCSASNTMSVAGLVKLKPEIVNLQDGLFEVLLVKYPKNIIQLFKILHGALHSDFKSEMFEFIKSKEISYEFSNDQTPWTLDGEKQDGCKNVMIQCIEKAIDLYI